MWRCDLAVHQEVWQTGNSQYEVVQADVELRHSSFNLAIGIIVSLGSTPGLVDGATPTLEASRNWISLSTDSSAIICWVVNCVGEPTTRDWSACAASISCNCILNWTSGHTVEVENLNEVPAPGRIKDQRVETVLDKSAPQGIHRPKKADPSDRQHRSSSPLNPSNDPTRHAKAQVCIQVRKRQASTKCIQVRERAFLDRGILAQTAKKERNILNGSQSLGSRLDKHERYQHRQHNIILHDGHDENISNYKPPLAKTSDHYTDWLR